MSRLINARPVPWYDWAEWDAVRHDLFGQSRSAVQRALKRIAVWKCRGKLPLAVESTATLQEIVIGDISQYAQSFNRTLCCLTQLL